MAEDQPFVDIFKENLFTKKRNAYGLKREIRFISERIIVEYSPEETLSVREIVHPLSPFRTPEPYFSVNLTDTPDEYVTSIDFHDHAPYFPYAKSTGEINLLRYINNFNDKNFAKISCQNIMKMPGECIDKLRNGKLDKGFMAMYYYTHGCRDESTLSIVDLVDPSKNVSHFDTIQPINDFTWTWYNEVTLAACDDKSLRVIDIRTPKSYDAIFFNGGIKKTAVNSMRMGEILGWNGEKLLLFDIRRLELPVKQHTISFPDGDTLAEMRYNVYLPKQLFLHTTSHRLYSMNFDEKELFASKHSSEQVVDDTERITFKNIDRGVYTRKMRAAREREFKMQPHEVSLENYFDHFELAKVDEEVRMPITWTDPHVYTMEEAFNKHQKSQLTKDFNVEKTKERSYAEHCYQLETSKCLYLTEEVETFDFTLPGVNGVLIVRSDEVSYNLISSPLHYEGSSSCDISIDAISEMRKVQCREMIPSHMLYLMSSRIEAGWNVFDCKEPDLHELILAMTKEEQQFWCIWLRNSGHLQYSANDYSKFTRRGHLRDLPDTFPPFRFAKHNNVELKQAMSDVMRISSPFYRLFLPNPVPDVKHGKKPCSLSSLYPIPSIPKKVDARKKGCRRHWNRLPNRVRYLKKGRLIMVGRGNLYGAMFREFKLRRGSRKRFAKVLLSSSKLKRQYPYSPWNKRSEEKRIKEEKRLKREAERKKLEDEKKKQEEEEKAREELEKAKLEPPRPPTPPPPPPPSRRHRGRKGMPPPPQAPPQQPGQQTVVKEEVKLIIASKPRPMFRYKPKRLNEMVMVEMLKKSLSKSMKVKREEVFKSLMKQPEVRKLAQINDERLIDLKTALIRSKRVGWHSVYQKNFLFPDKCSYDQLISCFFKLYNRMSRQCRNLDASKNDKRSVIIGRKLSHEMPTGRLFIESDEKFNKFIDIEENPVDISSSSEDDVDADVEDNACSDNDEPVEKSEVTISSLCQTTFCSFPEIMRRANKALLEVQRNQIVNHAIAEKSTDSDLHIIICDWKSPLITILDKTTGEVVYQYVVPLQKIQHIRTYFQYGYDEVLPPAAQSEYWSLHHFNYKEHVHPFFVYPPSYTLKPNESPIPRMEQYEVKGMKLSDTYYNALQKTFYGRYFPLICVPTPDDDDEFVELELPWEKTQSPLKRRTSKDLIHAQRKLSLNGGIIVDEIPFDMECEHCWGESIPHEICLKCDLNIQVFGCEKFETIHESSSFLRNNQRVVCPTCKGKLYWIQCAKWAVENSDEEETEQRKIAKMRRRKSRTKSNLEIEDVTYVECDDQFVEKCYEKIDEEEYMKNQDPILHFFMGRKVNHFETKEAQRLAESMIHEDAFAVTVKRDSQIEEKKAQAVASNHQNSSNELEHYTWTNEKTGQVFVKWLTADEIRHIEARKEKAAKRKAEKEAKKEAKKAAEEAEAALKAAAAAAAKTPPPPASLPQSPRRKKTPSTNETSIDKKRKKFFAKDFDKVGRIDGTSCMQRTIMRRNIRQKCKEAKKTQQQKKAKPHKKPKKKIPPTVEVQAVQPDPIKRANSLPKKLRRRRKRVKKIKENKVFDLGNSGLVRTKNPKPVSALVKQIVSIFKESARRRKPIRRVKKLTKIKSRKKLAFKRTKREKRILKTLRAIVDAEEKQKLEKKKRLVKASPHRLRVTWAKNLTGEVVKQGRKIIKKREDWNTSQLVVSDSRFVKDVIYQRVNKDRFEMISGTYIPPMTPAKGCFRQRMANLPERTLSKKNQRRRNRDLKRREEQLGTKIVAEPLTHIQNQLKDAKKRLGVKLFKQSGIAEQEFAKKWMEMKKKEKEKQKKAEKLRREARREARKARKLKKLKKLKIDLKTPVPSEEVSTPKPTRPPLSPLQPLSLHWPVEEQGLTVGRRLTAPNTPTENAPASPYDLSTSTSNVKESTYSKLKRRVLPFLRPVSAVFSNRRRGSTEPQTSQLSQQQEPSTSAVDLSSSQELSDSRELSMRRNTIDATVAAAERKPAAPINIRPLPRGYITHGSSAEDVAAMLGDNKGWLGSDSPPSSPEAEQDHAFSAPGPVPFSSPKTSEKKTEKPLIKKTMRSATMPSLIPLLPKKDQLLIKRKLEKLTSMEKAKYSICNLNRAKFPSLNIPSQFYMDDSSRPTSSISLATIRSIEKSKRNDWKVSRVSAKALKVMESLKDKPYTQKMMMKFLRQEENFDDLPNMYQAFISNYPFLRLDEKNMLKLHSRMIKRKFFIRDKKSETKKRALEMITDAIPAKEVKKREKVLLVKGVKRPSRRNSKSYTSKKRLSLKMKLLEKLRKSRKKKSKKTRRKKFRRSKTKKSNTKFLHIQKMKPIPCIVNKTSREAMKDQREKKRRRQKLFKRYFDFAQGLCRRALNRGRQNDDWRLYHMISDILKHRVKDFMEYKRKQYQKFKNKLNSSGIVMKTKTNDNKFSRNISKYRQFEQHNLLKKTRIPIKPSQPKHLIIKLNEFSTKNPIVITTPAFPNFDENVEKILLPTRDSDIEETPPPSETESESEYAETDSTTATEKEKEMFWQRKSEQSAINVKGLPGLLYLARLVQEKIGEHLEDNYELEGPGFEHYRNKIEVSPLRRFMLLSIGCRMPDQYKRKSVSSNDLGQSFANMFTAMCYGHGDHLPKLIELLHRMIGYPVADYTTMDDPNQSWIITKLYRKFVAVQSGNEEYALAKMVREAMLVERKKLSESDEDGEPVVITELDGIPWSVDEWMQAVDQFLNFSKTVENVYPSLLACVYFMRMVMTNGYSSDIVDEIIELGLPIREKMMFIINFSPHDQIVRNTLQVFQRVHGLDRLPFVGLGYHKDSLAILHEEAVLNGDCQLAAHLLVVGQCLDNKSEEEMLPDIGSKHIQNRDIGGILEDMLGTSQNELGPRTLQDVFPISYVRDPQGNEINLSCEELSKLLECEVSKYLAVLEVLKGSSYLDRTCNHIDRLKKPPTIFSTEVACTHCHLPVFKGHELATLGEEVTLSSVNEQLRNQRIMISSRKCKLNEEEEDLKPYVAPPPSAANEANPKAEEELQHRSADQSCQSCRRPLPRCTVCMCYYLGHLPEIEWENDKSIKDFAICYLCNHGGHVQHLVEWFQIELECPVHNCKCRCATIQQSILQQTQIRESMIQSSNMRARSHICNPKCALNPNHE